MRPFHHAAAATLIVAAVLFSVRVAPSATHRTPNEPHLANIKQLTHGGDNAESYFSRDGKRLIFQSTRNGRTCDQEYVMNVDGTNVKRVSTGLGKTTCGYFYDG